jgi:hypothetical protein
MDINQQDRAALNAKLCPDCSNPVSFEESGPWCKVCDVWFEFNISGWIIRNRDAAQYFSLLRIANRRQRFNGKRKETQEKATKAEYEAVNDSTWSFRQEPLDRKSGVDRYIGNTVTHYPRLSGIPVSLYRWFL